MKKITINLSLTKAQWALLSLGIKYIVPSTRFRQFIKNKIRNLNTKTYNPPKLLENDKKNIYEQYFKKDTELLEKLIDRKMNWF